MAKNNHFVFGYEMKMEAEKEEAEILLYGYITQYKWDEDDPDVTAREFDKLLKEAKAAGAKKLRLRINSGGGDVWQAVAMRTMLINSAFDEISVDVEGLCASAATLFVCLPGVHVRIADGSEFMIHNPITRVYGNSADFRKALDRLTKMEETDHAMYAARTGQTTEQIKKWMDDETWFTAKEAVEYGFADEVLESETVAACTVPDDVMRAMESAYLHVPENVVRAKSTNVSDTEKAPAGESVTENTTNIDEEERDMEIKDITMDQLRAENSALYEAIMQAGANAERERMNEIDDLTPMGYESMAQEAKQNGVSAMEFCKQIAKAQRQKGKDFLTERAKEVEQAEQVAGGDVTDNDHDDEADLQKHAKEMAALAESADGFSDSMY